MELSRCRRQADQSISSRHTKTCREPRIPTAIHRNGPASLKSWGTAPVFPFDPAMGIYQTGLGSSPSSPGRAMQTRLPGCRGIIVFTVLAPSLSYPTPARRAKILTPKGKSRASARNATRGTGQRTNRPSRRGTITRTPGGRADLAATDD